ncbi:MAG: NAD-dependent epimerase/dehydratase family protein [Propionibacteriaceae bacterium]|nr:NAD-dependent epimerase/dehydratase family protein [Propionibacteriaceae bacterium]
MGLLDSPIYREDIARIASLDLAWDRLADKSLVLSGASGMIGSFLVDVLMARNAEGLNCTIHALARNRISLEERFHTYTSGANLVLIAADVTQELMINSADYVIHAASNTHPRAYALDPIGTIMTNVLGTYKLLDLAVRTSAQRAIFLSTVEIYGENRSLTDRFSESDLGYIDCNTVRAGYPESKRTGEALCQSFREQYGLDIVIPRLPRTYGPSMRLDDSKALSQFLLNAVAGQDIVLKSEGKQHYSYCHVADVVGAILTCTLHGESGHAYNVADPSGDILLRDLAALVAGTVGRKVAFQLPDAVETRGFSTATHALLDGSKLADLGWRCLYDITEGITRTVEVLKSLSQ